MLVLILRSVLLFWCVCAGDLRSGFVVLLHNLVILGCFGGDWFVLAGFGLVFRCLCFLSYVLVCGCLRLGLVGWVACWLGSLSVVGLGCLQFGCLFCGWCLLLSLLWVVLWDLRVGWFLV